MDALRTLLDAAIEWRGPIVEHVRGLADAPFRAAGEAALGAVFGVGAGARTTLPPSAPANSPPASREQAAHAPLTDAQAALIDRALAANAGSLALPVPGPPPAGPGPKDVLRAALVRFLQNEDPRGARVAALVAEQCTQEAQDLAVVMAEDLENAAKRNGAKARPGAARAWADAGAIAYLNHPKIALSRLQKAHELGADDVETRIWLGTLYYRLGRVGEAEASYRAAEQKAWPDDQETRAVILCNLGCVCVTRGDLAAADAHFQTALRLVETIGDKSRQSAMIGNLGLVSYTRGDLISANDLCRRALALAEEAGDKERAALQYGNLGVLATNRGDARLAREYFDQALDLYEEMGAEDHEGARNVRAHLAEL
jgi:tetratricopeptide (TPR) repeat protein